MSVHFITEPLSDEQLANRENVAFERVYTCQKSTIRQHENILLWHKQRIQDRVLDIRPWFEEASR